MKFIPDALNNLTKSRFRSSFKLDCKDLDYLNRIGIKTIESHARDFVFQRLASRRPENDGRQTPFKGHPVFKAQHATATCCRNCLKKWYNISKNKNLDTDEIDFIVKFIMAWIKKWQILKK